MFKLITLIGWLGLAGLLAGCASVRPTGNLYDHVARSTVEILVNGRLEGSGWFAEPGDQVVTAAHVVAANDPRIEIITATGERLSVRLTAVDRGHDLALLTLPATAQPHPALAIAARVPAPGSEVFVYGAVQFRHDLLLPGKIARQTPSFEFYTGKQYVQVYYIGGASPHGTSGGCWVDRTGQVVGNQSGYIRHHDAPSGVALVAPPQAIRRLVTTRQSAATPTMRCAIEELWERPVEFIKRFPPGTEGVVTINPQENGPAYRAGLTKEYVVIALDGQPVRYRDQFMNRLRSHKPGDEIQLDVLKPDDPQSKRLTVRLEAVEDSPP